MGELCIEERGRILNEIGRILILLVHFERKKTMERCATCVMDWSSELDKVFCDPQIEVDLTGGYYDAGNNVKFGFPMAFTVTLLAWSAVDFGQRLAARDELEHLKEAIKWGMDYFIKAHPEAEVFYAEVGDGNSDHQCWQRPESMTTPRSSYRLDASNPGSDLAAETAAALAAASIIFKESNGDYSQTLLSHARELFDFGRNRPGTYTSSIGVAKGFYNSSGYEVWFLNVNANYAASDYAWESATRPGTALMMLDTYKMVAAALMMLDTNKMVASASSRNPTLAGALTRLHRCAFGGSLEVIHEKSLVGQRVLFQCKNANIPRKKACV